MEKTQTLEMYDGTVTTKVGYNDSWPYTLEIRSTENLHTLCFTQEEAIELRNFLNEVLPK